MNKVLYIILIVILSKDIFSQSIDKVEVVIGDEIILTSDIEAQYLQYLAQGGIKSSERRCEVIEDLLSQKLLVNQAKLDSIKVSDDEIETEISNRFSYFESQLGSMANVEEYFGKSSEDIEIALKKVIKDQFYTQRMQTQITSNIKVTPAEVKELFSTLEANNSLLL